MRTRRKRLAARIMAVLMAFTLLPFRTWGTADVVMAEESEISADTGGGFSSDAESLTADEETTEEETEISSADEEETETSAPAEETEKADDEKETDVKEETREEEKDSAETDNKATVEHIHNFTASGKSSEYYTINGNLSTGKGTVTYEGLTLTQCLKLESSTSISFTAKGTGTLTLVFVETAATIKVDGTKYTAPGDGIITLTQVVAGSHTITKADTANLFYMMFVEEVKEVETVATPAAASDSGELKVGDKITLSCDTADATIYYTTDGSDPKDNASKNTYADGITIVSNMVNDNKITIKAYATKADCTDSEVAVFTYTVSTELGENQLKAPTAEPDSGEVAKGTQVVLKSEDNADIYYTTDGTTPGRTSTRFQETDPIIINEGTTVKAIAIAEDKDDSFIAEFTYTIKQPKIGIASDSRALIESVELEGDISFTDDSGNEIFNIELKAETVGNPSSDIETAAQELKKGEGKICYYDFSLVNADNPSEAVKLAEGAGGKLKIKMPYSSVTSAAGKRNEILVLHGTQDKLEVTKETDGFCFFAESFSPYTVIVNPPLGVQDITIKESAGYEEGAYAEWETVDGADGYMAYVALAGGEFKRIDDQLIRQYDNYWRVDTVGLAKGTYYIKVNAVVLEGDGENETATVIATKTTDALKVTNYDRSGFAFSKDSPFKTGSGAYNEDGTLRSGAQVIYVTAETAKTCKAMLHTAGANKDPVEVTGLQEILDNKNKGDATKDDILDIRIIGCVTKDDLDHISSSKEGLQVKGKNANSEMNVTIEGIGEDATVKGFGFLIRYCGNVELRNFGILNYMDDGVSMDTGNCNIWVHDLDIFYGSTGGDKDQAKGDGTIDIKAGSTYVTVSYNHFWDSGKSSLCGMEKPTDPEFMVTYHHNWFDHSDSRHARVRRGTIHLYNNYYDGNAKYGVGSTNGSSIFVESNYFRNCNYPMMISTQASDALGGNILSGENGGIIKAYNNVIKGAKNLVYQNSDSGTKAANGTDFDAYLVLNRADKVPESVKALTGGTTYNNFDTSDDYDLGVTEDKIDVPENVPTVVTAKAGRLNGGDLKWQFDNATEDTNYSVISELKTAVVNYKTSVKAVSGGVTGNPAVLEDNGADAPGKEDQDVQKPTASPSAGEVEKGTGVKLSCATANAKIYYTLNGLDPTDKDTLYTGEIIIERDTTIKAIAAAGGVSSEVSSFKYTLPGGTTPTPPPGTDPPGGDDDDKPARGTYTLDIKDAYETAVPNAASNRAEDKGTNDFYTILFLGKTDSSGNGSGSAISEKSSELEFEGGYKSNRYFLTSGAAKTNQASVKIVTKDKTTVTVWWQPGGTTDLQQRQLTVLNAGGDAVYTSSIENLDTGRGYVTSFELANAGTYYIGSAKSSINIYKIEVKYPDKPVDPPTADPSGGSLKKGDTVALSGIGDIYYTIVTNETDLDVPISDSNKYSEPIAIMAEVGTTVTIKAVAVFDGISSQPAVFTYTIVEDSTGPGTEIKVPLSLPEAFPAPDDGRKYPIGVDISLTSKEGGTIHYTLDGTDPKNADGTPADTSRVLAENETISLDTEGTHTIKAFADKDGYLPSETASFTYTVSKDSDVIQLTQPKITPASKEVKAGDKITVTITKAESDPDGTEIYYTTDGTIPVKNEGLRYKEPFELTIDKTVTINAIAVKDGALPSTVASVTYTVKTVTATPKPDGIYIAGLEESYPFTGAKIIPDIEVWYCYQGVETLLSLGVDYTVSYKNNVKLTSETQKAEVIVTGKGNYAGTGNAKTFSIIDAADAAGTLADLKGAKLKEKIAPQEYSKEAILPDFTLMMKDGSEVTYTKNTSSAGKYMRADGEKMDVNVAVSNNINKGTATILVTGGKDSKGKATSFKTAFKIMPIDISRATVDPTAGTYAVNGAAPGSVKVTIQLNGQTVELKNGKDYTVKYSNNKNAGQGKVTVTGKGNYTKKHAPVDYTINKLDLSTLHVDAVTACEGTKAGKVKATIADANGNVIPLKASQYKLAILEYNEPAKTTEASPYDSAAQLEAGKRITVIATAADEANLEKDTATREAEFKVGIDISKAKFKIKKDAVKEYTGNAVTLAGNDFDNPTIKTGGAQVPLVMGKDYEIASYSNNINKGTAIAVIKGIGDYSGTKTVKFKITQKPMQITKADPKPWELWNKLLNSLAN